MFALEDSKGQCFLKTTVTTKSDFEEKGLIRNHKISNYILPDKVINNPKMLVAWTYKSIAVSKTKINH